MHFKFSFSDQLIFLYEKVFNSFILAKNNVRSLRGESILILLENMYLYDFMNKDALLNILPNISTDRKSVV